MRAFHEMTSHLRLISELYREFEAPLRRDHAQSRTATSPAGSSASENRCGAPSRDGELPRPKPREAGRHDGPQAAASAARRTSEPMILPER